MKTPDTPNAKPTIPSAIMNTRYTKFLNGDLRVFLEDVKWGNESDEVRRRIDHRLKVVEESLPFSLCEAASQAGCTKGTVNRSPADPVMPDLASVVCDGVPFEVLHVGE